MAKALYRKYRSKSLAEVVGQKPVTQALQNALKSGQISHAYLFTGPRGVGKTSIARILAYEINGIPYESDELPLDIIEIDAASNRRIDEIRDLREKVRIAPASAKFKVYIIDEVHMLTREAFNALLKTLEEPPAHVVFILATTEAHKLPETIVSRTQRYSFKLISPADVASHLRMIADKEKIDITDEALMMIAKHSGGSLRDALSLLDQIRHTTGKIDEHTVQQSIGLPPTEHVQDLLKAVAGTDASKVVEILRNSQDNGVSAVLLAQAVVSELRLQLAEPKPLLDLASTLKLMQELLEVDASQQPETVLEVALLGALLDQKAPLVTIKQEKAQTGPPLTLTKPVAEAKRDIAALEAKADHKKATAAPKKPTEAPAVAVRQLSADIWQEVLESIKTTHNTLYSVLRMAHADLSAAENNCMTLFFSFPFHQKRINEARNKQVVLDTFARFGVPSLEIICEYKKLAPAPVQEVSLEPITAKDVPKRDEGWVDQIKTVFGGAEVLE